MANVKISDMVAGATLTGAEQVELNQGGNTRRTTTLLIAVQNMQAADYSGIAPTWTPTGSLGVAIDTVTEQIWWYYAGAWH